VGTMCISLGFNSGLRREINIVDAVDDNCSLMLLLLLLDNESGQLQHLVIIR
jgi:hypothetical protein